MLGTQWIVKTLKEKGVTTVFGYPGGQIMPLYDALYDGGIEHVLCRHEQGAAMAAIGYARSTGKTGVCIATSGPGATNIITGLADALIDSVPIVAITGQVPTNLIGTDAFQEVDVLGLSLACTKHSYLINDAKQLPNTLEEAFNLANSGRPGPILIDVPKDVQLANLDYQQYLTTSSLNNTPDKSTLFTVSPEAIKLAKQMIAQAQKPMLYIGGGVGLSGAISELKDFMSLTHIPSVSTLKGLGVADANNPYYLGLIGMHGAKAANLAVQECDLLIALGVRFDDRVTGKLNEFARHAKVIHVDIDQAEINKLRQTHLGLQADIKQVLPLLTQTVSIEAWHKRVNDLKVQHPTRYDHPGEAIYAPALLKIISDRKSANTIITTDVGQHQMWTAQHMCFNHPQNFITSSGLGTMGFGLPAAIGAQMARPNDCVICISGDGSFMMNVQELTTIKRKKLPIKIVLIDNQRLGMVRQWQELFFNERYSETNLSDNPDFLILAKAFDIPSETITKKSQINAALNNMFNASGAYLLHVRIDELENVWPLVPPGAANENMLDKSCKE
ncbi:acetolactate synthase 2 catalytic subunit [Gilliamella sp. B2776]|uniref:acetolactate synthase 2 catalytic subunit n=1 Tax=unclassified Gilliamella TaxID=2685620 RepID=UPI00226A020D|nr:MULTISPECIES: acetolactate synthase 2 catalytic subunit [unclassified Gilliamella]MCX8650630.1 acetolactate synthase 2 catalytic subunit [Gilliamella sp. B2779]MCX8654409.1 acetolactate synthase 2 catalytic subunit [Gilliamella sp. B2737]MCX8657006.1 acetolactate synthase 2 catalytic subunit [Gilliamella sp. B2894]MCX8665725.1 acetolactate synthase 2 catalytic subunit [Gilliamella sp. B2887]MCX8692505.1 acetolactate synthase 2 catalytic subunit [Gilliamella sp. B2776]